MKIWRRNIWRICNSCSFRTSHIESSKLLTILARRDFLATSLFSITPSHSLLPFDRKKCSFLLRASREITTFMRYPSFFKWRNALELSIFSLLAISPAVILMFSSTNARKPSREELTFQVEITIWESSKPLFNCLESRSMVQINALNVFCTIRVALHFSYPPIDLFELCPMLKWHKAFSVCNITERKHRSSIM